MTVNLQDLKNSTVAFVGALFFTAILVVASAPYVPVA